MLIEQFIDEHWFLSNYCPCPLEYRGKYYNSSEHAYQAATAHNSQDEKLIRLARTSAQAQKIAMTVFKKKDWEAGKEQIMYEVVTAKFSQNDAFREALLATGNAELIEDNWWEDTYWGVYLGVGHNKLGKILMRVREELSQITTSILSDVPTELSTQVSRPW